MFSNSKNLLINGGQFSSVQGDMHVHAAASQRYGLKLLLDNIIAGALHDASERGDPPRCHENTRVAIRKEIMEWIQDPSDRDKFIMWLYGPAGSGKTAIVQSIAEALAEQGLLAASFFFWRTAAGRNTSTHFIATLAYQLSRFIPAMEDTLYTTIENDPAIFSRTPTAQLRAFIIDPLKFAQHAQHVQIPTPLVIIVDGLDECSPTKSQTELIELLRMAVMEFQSIPLRILMSSRPEYEIRTAFSDSTENKVGYFTTKFALDNDYQTNEDIRVYLLSKFQSIREEHLRLGSRLPSPWPAEADIDRVVEKASGQFIFAATVIKFLDSPRINPVDHLKIILGLSRPREGQRPFAQLDELYRTILSLVFADDLPNVLELLTFLVLQPNSEFCEAHVAHLLGLEVQKTLIDIHALVFVPTDDKEPLSLHHASLSDFLLDKSRSCEYYIDPAQGHLKLAQCHLQSLHNEYFIALPVTYILNPPFGLIGFIHHSKALSPNKDFANSLASYEIKSALKHYSHGFSHDRDNYEPDRERRYWSVFFDCVKYHEGGEGAIFRRLWHDSCIFFLEEFPMELRSFIPTILTLRKIESVVAWNLGLILTLFSLTDDNRVKLWWLHNKKICSYISNIVNDKENGNQYYIENSGYVPLAKKVIEVIFSNPGEDAYGRLSILTRHARPYDNWYPELLSHISVDEEFANFLIHCHAFQFRPAINIQRRLAEYNLAYIQKCGIDYLEHTHRPDMLGCIICDDCRYAFVVKPDKFVQQQFEKLFVGLISDFLKQYHPCIPAILGLGRDDRDSVRKLLEFSPNTRWTEDEDICTILSGLLNNKERAGRYYVYGDSRLALVKQIIKARCSIRDCLLNNSYGIDSMLPSCSVDFDVATYLRDHMLQITAFGKGDDKWASPDSQKSACEASLEYALRCGLPVLEHIHPPDTKVCIICDKYTSGGASVVDLEHLPYTPTPRLLPLSWAMDDAWCRGAYETNSDDESMCEADSEGESVYETANSAESDLEEDSGSRKWADEEEHEEE